MPIQLIIKTLSVLILTGCFTSALAQKDETIVTINGKKFSKQEFENTYKKNNSQLAEETQLKSPAEYMELFINFKLKVMEAERLGLDTISSFTNELKGYRTELAKPYLSDIQYSEQMVKNAYERTRWERKASHILIEVTNGDTLKAYNQILGIRDRILKGDDFNEMAYLYSQDPSAKQNRGELGWFSAFQMVFPFEEAAYHTAVEQVSMPVKTQFGYHLIKIEAERESKGELSAAHIMKKFIVGKDNDAVKPQIDSIYQALLQGASFEEMAQKYSDDLYSKNKGGVIPNFTEGKMIPSFAEAAFALKNDGDISPVIRTPYGWHIIKRLKHIPIPSYEELKNQLIENIKQNPQISDYSRERFIIKLKNEYNFSQKAEGYEYLIANCPLNGASKRPSPVTSFDPTKVLFVFADKKFTTNDFINFLKKKFPEGKEVTNNQTLEQLLIEFEEQELLAYEDAKLEEKHPEFQQLMKEYHDGILLFNVSEKMVWNKAAEDTLGLKNFYESNKTKYLDEEKFAGWIIKCKDFATRAKADEILSKDPMDKDQLMLILNKDQGDAIQISEVKLKKGENAVVDYYVWHMPKPTNLDDRTEFIRGEKLPPLPKLLNESRGMHIADYQNLLEQKWLNDLHRQYKIEVNNKLLKRIESIK